MLKKVKIQDVLYVLVLLGINFFILNIGVKIRYFYKFDFYKLTSFILVISILFLLVLLFFDKDFIFYEKSSSVNKKKAILGIIYLISSYYIVGKFLNNSPEVKFEKFALLHAFRTSLLSPVYEEMFFTKVLFKKLSNIFGDRLSKILVALIFTFSHKLSWSSISHFISSLFNISLYKESKNIFIPIALHIFNNTFIIWTINSEVKMNDLNQVILYGLIYFVIILIIDSIRSVDE